VVLVFCLVPAVSAVAQESDSEEPQTYKEKYEQQQVTDRSAMYMSFLWDFTYDRNEPSPNTHPWLIRIGYGFTF